jgi:hypothetical protein
MHQNCDTAAVEAAAAAAAVAAARLARTPAYRSSLICSRPHQRQPNEAVWSTVAICCLLCMPDRLQNMFCNCTGQPCGTTVAHTSNDNDQQTPTQHQLHQLANPLVANGLDSRHKISGRACLHLHRATRGRTDGRVQA